jgi:hypothetical protein
MDEQATRIASHQWDARRALVDLLNILVGTVLNPTDVTSDTSNASSSELNILLDGKVIGSISEIPVPRPMTVADYQHCGLEEKITEFLLHYGPLRLIWASKHEPGNVVLSFAQFFQNMWKTHTGPDVRRLNSVLNLIFKATEISGKYAGPAIQADFLTGKFDIVPRDLLDALALEFMRSRKALSRCERCTRFFIKTFSRDRYCSTDCGTEARTEAQREWMRKFRAQQKRGHQKSKSRKTKRTA